MKIQRKILILSILDVLVLIGLVFSFSHFLKKPAPYIPLEPKYLTDIEELYSQFAPYMKSTVDSYLATIECQPTKYDKSDSEICFHCNMLDACFNYVWVKREKGEDKMNPKGIPSLKGDYSKETELNFHSLGVFKSLNCKCEQECICDNGIKARLEERGMVIFTFPKDVNIKEAIKKIVAKAEKPECEFEDLDGIVNFSCGTLLRGTITENEVIF